jgi:cell division transport system ATP-binding protein
VIEFESVSKRYSDGYDALARVEFAINAGEMVF